jgi:hypothetical protein
MTRERWPARALTCSRLLWLWCSGVCAMRTCGLPGEVGPGLAGDCCLLAAQASEVVCVGGVARQSACRQAHTDCYWSVPPNVILPVEQCTVPPEIRPTHVSTTDPVTVLPLNRPWMCTTSCGPKI